MAIDIVVEVLGEIFEAAADLVFDGARGWRLFWRIIFFFVVVPAIIFGLYYWLT